MLEAKKVYGPYTRKDGRQHVILIYADSSRRTVSYPKFLMEQYLGRELDPDTETVHHINGDFTDNRLENLQIIDRQTHATNDVTRVELVEIECVWCGSKARKRAAYLEHNRKLGKAGPFCGRSCAGKYGASVQSGAAKLPTQSGCKKNRRKYFKLGSE